MFKKVETTEKIQFSLISVREGLCKEISFIFAGITNLDLVSDDLEPAFRKKLNSPGIDTVFFFKDPLGQGFFGILFENGNDALDDNRTGVDSFVDKVDRTA